MIKNITKDMSKRFVAIEHPVLGPIVINSHLHNIMSEPMSDTEEVTEPGAGGGRVVKIKKDTARKISIEVSVSSIEELFLRRAIRFKLQKFNLQWADEGNNLITSQGGIASDCYIKDLSNDRNADTVTFEVWSMSYTGD